MKSEKSKVLGALLPSESCHNEFEALYLQYSYDKAHTFFFGALSRVAAFPCIQKEKLLS